MNCHIGLLIKAEMERQERTPSWLARKIFCDRTNIHKIYKKDSIDTGLLFNISKALNHNFFNDLSDTYNEEDVDDMDRKSGISATSGNKPAQTSQHQTNQD